MSTGETVVAVYDGFESANAVLQALLDEGFLQSDVGLAVSNANGTYDKLDVHLKKFEIIDDEENGFGALLASLGGAFFAPTSLVIPALGPVIAAGPFIDLLGGETGAVIGSIAASLVHLGIPQQEAGYYAEAVHRGHALITVHIRTAKAMTLALEILRHNHPMRIKNRANQWIGFEANDDFSTSPDMYYVAAEAIGRFPYMPPTLA